MNILTLGFILATPATVPASPDARIEALEQQVEALAEAYEEAQAGPAAGQKAVTLGGYGVLKYSHLDVDGEDQIQMDLHRLVLLVGYDFSERIRMVSEFEIEHALAGDGKKGEVEVEQAYVAFDLPKEATIQAGVMLVPVGILNETHEPPTHYGVNRPVIERAIIPTTWWVGGVMLKQRFANGLSYDLLLSEGLKTSDGDGAFNLRSGRQKTSKAQADAPALTGRVSWTGLPGLTVSAYAQYQHDLDQAAEPSYADSAVLLGGHAIYEIAGVKVTALYAQWMLQGDEAKDAGRDAQGGGYLELSYRPWSAFGVFARHNRWSLAEDDDRQQTEAGVNVWPHEGVVLKADFQHQNDDAGAAQGVNLGVGWAF